MRFISETAADGVSERSFSLGDVPGVLWSPTGATDGPLVLLAHGGEQHKKAPAMVARAHHFVRACGCSVVAIDAPGHGDRPRTAQDERFSALIRQRMAAGEPVADEIARGNVSRAAQAVPEWQGVLDALPGFGPVGLWGVSMGSAIGIPLAAAEARIAAAVFGLAGDLLVEAARRVRIPIEFLLQWDDEHIPRSAGLALFEAFASEEKSLHANPGRHADVPHFEVDSAGRFFTRHLG